MRLAVVLFAGLTGLLTASAQSALSKLERTPFFGNDYVCLADWAKSFNFQIHWMRQSEEVQLTNPWSRLVFTLDSHRAEINGVTVLLSAPVLKVVLTRNGDNFLPLSDRPECARRRGADLFVSLHFNASLVDKNHVKGFALVER